METPPQKPDPIFTKWYIQVSVLAVTLFVYVVTKNMVFLLLLGIEIIAMVALEVRQGTKKHGWKAEVVDTLIALLVAVVIWYGAAFVLDTQSPASAVVSCSMLPNLARGDFVVVQGGHVNAYELEMTEKEINELANDAEITHGDEKRTVKGSLFSYCSALPSDPFCKSFYEAPPDFVEKKGSLTYHYSNCLIKVEDSEKQIPCVTTVDHNGKNYPVSTAGDTIVYGANKDEYFALIGDIVHRAYFTITTPTGREYYLTKGDNNPILDVQVYDYRFNRINNAVSKEEYKGKVIARIPYVGYFKLAISGLLQEPEQCKTQLEQPTVS